MNREEAVEVWTEAYHELSNNAVELGKNHMAQCKVIAAGGFPRDIIYGREEIKDIDIVLSVQSVSLSRGITRERVLANVTNYFRNKGWKSVGDNAYVTNDDRCCVHTVERGDVQLILVVGDITADTYVKSYFDLGPSFAIILDGTRFVVNRLFMHDMVRKTCTVFVPSYMAEDMLKGNYYGCDTYSFGKSITEHAPRVAKKLNVEVGVVYHAKHRNEFEFIDWDYAKTKAESGYVWQVEV